MKFTSNSEDLNVITANKTLKAQVLASLMKKPQTSFELENSLNRLHQSVSSTLTRLEQAGTVKIVGYRPNEYGNNCSVYAIKGK